MYPALEESVCHPIRIPQSICRDARRGGGSGGILFPRSKELPEIGTEVATVLNSGATWIDQVDIYNEAKMEFCVRFMEALFRIHRYYWDLMLTKSQIGLNDLSVETT